MKSKSNIKTNNRKSNDSNSSIKDAAEDLNIMATELSSLACSKLPFGVMQGHLADLKDIMLKSKISFLRRKMEQYQLHGTKLVFSDDAVEALAEIALTHPSGARGLRQLISHALAPWDFQLADLLTSGIHEIHFDRQSIHDGTKAHVEMGSPTAAPRTPMPNAATTQRESSDDDDDICIF